MGEMTLATSKLFRMETPKLFRIGNKIRCIKAKHMNISVGEFYYIVDIKMLSPQTSPQDWFKISTTPDLQSIVQCDGVDQFYQSARFELAEEENENKKLNWMI